MTLIYKWIIYGLAVAVIMFYWMPKVAGDSRKSLFIFSLFVVLGVLDYYMSKKRKQIGF